MKTSSSVWEQKLVSYQQVIASADPDDSPLQADDSQPAFVPLSAFLLLRPNNVATQLQHLLAYHPDVHAVQHVTSDAEIMPNNQYTICVCEPAHATRLSMQFTRARLQLVVVGSNNADALKAFECGAAAFIHLPLREQHVMQVVSDISARLQEHIQRQRIRHLLENMMLKLNIAPDEIASWLRSRLSQRAKKRVSFRSDNAWCSLACEDINWVQAAGDYMCIYTSGENFVVRTTLADLSRKLTGDTFQRVNRSELVNRHFVKMVEQCANRVAYVVLDDGTRLKISRRHFAGFWQSSK